MSHERAQDNPEDPAPPSNPLGGWDYAVFFVPVVLASLAENLTNDILRLSAPESLWIVRFLVRVAVYVLVYFAVFIPLARWRWKWFRWPR